jgi:hypothetical protein
MAALESDHDQAGVLEHSEMLHDGEAAQRRKRFAQFARREQTKTDFPSEGPPSL